MEGLSTIDTQSADPRLLTMAPDLLGAAGFDGLLYPGIAPGAGGHLHVWLPA